MKKINGWTMAELVIAIIILIIVSALSVSVFKPDTNKARIFMYAAMKNLSKGNTAIIEKHNSIAPDNMDAGTKDWYCLNLADKFALSNEPNCAKAAAPKEVNFRFSNGMTLQGVASAWYTPYSGAGYSFKNIVVDIDGEKGVNKIGIDRFPLRIYKGSTYEGMIHPVNCGDDVVYNSAGTKITLSSSTGASPYCRQKFDLTGSVVANKNMLLDDQIVTYDVYQPVTDEEYSRAVIVATSLSTMAANCAAYGGNGFFSKPYCGSKNLRLTARCAKAETCNACSGSSPVSYDVCPFKTDGKTQTGSETACRTLAAEVNPKDMPCFILLHKPTAGLGFLAGSVIGELDI